MDPQASPTPVEPPGPADQKSFPAWGPFGTLAWSVLITIVFLVAQFFILLIYTFPARELPREEAKAAFMNLRFDGIFLSVCTFAALLVCTPLILGIVKLKRGSNLEDYLALRRPSLRQLLRWSLFTLAFCLLSDGIAYLLDQPILPDFMLKTYWTASPRWLLWLALVIAAPISEEICFRGFMFKGIAASRLGWAGATIVTAILWAAIHRQYDWYGISFVFGLGLLLGTARAKTHSTLLTMWLHSLINLLATAQAAFGLWQT